MARVDTDKKVNATQLGIELGRVPLVVGEGYVSAEGVLQAALSAAVLAHVADDQYADPQQLPPPDLTAQLGSAVAAANTTLVADPAAKTAIEALKSALTGTVGPGVEPCRST